MLFIRQGATHKVVIGPAVAVGDGFTPVTNVDGGDSDLQDVDEAAAIIHDNGTIVDLSAYTFAPITNADGYYHLTLHSDISGTVGHMTVVIQDDDLILPMRADFTILDTAPYDANFADAAAGPLQSTTAGRKLDVTATGAGGIDWGNIENKTTSNDLTQTDIQLCDTVSTNSDLVSAAAVVNEFETQSQADPTGFHVNVREWLSQPCAAVSVNGVPEVDLTHIKGTIVPQVGGGQVANRFGEFFDNATIQFTVGTGLANFKATGFATAAKLLAYVQLLARKDDAIENDNSTELTEINASGGSGGGTFLNETDALEGLRDRGDQAWLTGGGGGATKSKVTTDWTRTTGDDDGGAGSDTASVNATYFATGEINSGSYLEVDAVFTLDDATEVGRELDFWGFYDGSGAHTMQVQALDTVASTYEPIGTIGLAGAVEKHSFELSPNHTNASNGVVTIKFIHQGGTGNASHVFNVDKCQVNSSLASTTAAKLLSYVQLLARSDAAIEGDRSTELAEINGNEGSGAGDYSSQADSQEAARDRGDAAWITATGFATSGALSTHDGKLDTVDTNVDAILVDTGTTLQAELDAIQAAVITNAAGTDVAADIIALKAETALILADTGTDGVVVASASKTGYALSSAGNNSVADAVLSRDVDQVEGSANEHTLCTIVLAMLESSIASTTWTIKRTDGSTTHATKTVTADADADPITGVS